MLDDAGYIDIDDDGIRNMPDGGEDLDFRFIVRSESTDGVRAGELIAGWMDQIGIADEDRGADGLEADRRLARERLRPLHLGLGARPRSRLHPVRQHHERRAARGATRAGRTPSTTSSTRTSRRRRRRTTARRSCSRCSRSSTRNAPSSCCGTTTTCRHGAATAGRDSFQPTPDAEGVGGYALFQYGNYSYLSIEPATGEGATAAGGTGSGGIPAGVWIGIIAAVVIVIGGVMFARSRGDDEDKA